MPYLRKYIKLKKDYLGVYKKDSVLYVDQYKADKLIKEGYASESTEKAYKSYKTKKAEEKAKAKAEKLAKAKAESEAKASEGCEGCGSEKPCEDCDQSEDPE